MTYEETLHYLYTSTPVFQHSGASAYKPGLGTSIALDNHLGNPHKAYKTIHIAGTNGKGSVSHLLAATLMQAGFTVGLYTSPHLIDFRERIRVNGEMIPKEEVIDFVEKYRSIFEPLHPSFFELTSTLAFDYFRKRKVDYAIIEVGLGGRLDSTNIITPILSVITNISLDHTQFLGDTVEQIAAEKAGIIKPGIPVVIGEADKPSVLEVFKQKATTENAPFHYARQMEGLMDSEGSLGDDGYWHYPATCCGEILGELGGKVQCRNTRTVLAAIQVLRNEIGINIPQEAVRKAFAHVVELTGLMGRWQQLHKQPKVICDTGHNVGGWEYLSQHLDHIQKQHTRLHMIVGMVSDKDIDGVLSLMPSNANYLFTQASIPRALPANEMKARGERHGLHGEAFGTVEAAIRHSLTIADSNDLIFIGGSTFIVAEALPYFLNETTKNK